MDAGCWMLDVGVVEDDNGRSVALTKPPCFLEGVKFRSKATGCLRPLKCQFGAGCLVDTSARSRSDGVARQELPATGVVERENALATPFAEPRGRATRNSRTAHRPYSKCKQDSHEKAQEGTKRR
jgi:hypothetical protein